MNPFDWTGGPFLTLYLGLFIVAFIGGIVIPRWLRPPGREAYKLDPDQMAWLAGGRIRFVEAIVARLLARRALLLIGRNRFSAAPGAQGESAVESSALSGQDVVDWMTMQKRIQPYAKVARDKLRAMGLVQSAEDTASARFFATLPYALLIAFGSVKLLVGEARHKPVGFLTALLIVSAIFALVRWLSVDQSTRAGVTLVKDEQRVKERLKRAPTHDEIGLAVALFGTTVLAGSAWSDFHQLRSSSSSDGGGSDSGGGGCGGGGCGGCGG